MPTSTSSHRSRHTSLHPSSRIQEMPGNRREVLKIGQFPLKAFFTDEAISGTKPPRATMGAQIRCSGPVAGNGQLLFKCLLKMDHFARKGSQGHKGPRSVDRPCGWNRSVAINVFIKRWTISQTRATMGAQIRCSGPWLESVNCYSSVS